MVLNLRLTSKKPTKVSIDRSENMRRIRNKDTKPELRIRRMIHGMGYRYRLQGKNLPGRPDLVFTRKKKVIFVNGCFWHQHENCKISRIPKSNIEYWVPKLQRNVERDRAVQTNLEFLGWTYLVIWECEIKDPLPLAEKIKKFLQ